MSEIRQGERFAKGTLQVPELIAQGQQRQRRWRRPLFVGRHRLIPSVAPLEKLDTGRSSQFRGRDKGSTKGTQRIDLQSLIGSLWWLKPPHVEDANEPVVVVHAVYHT